MRQPDPPPPDTLPRFACDAMLGGLARWLRAAGYDAAFDAAIDDWGLIRLAMREGRILLSSDTGIFRVGVVRDGEVPALFIPHGLGKREQLALVLRNYRLPLAGPRCMACGGQLREVSQEQARDRAPSRSFAWQQQFCECERCGRLFWEGTHWQKIADGLRQAAGSSPFSPLPLNGGEGPEVRG
jgi:uncharacterized protein with PIN domain